MDIKELMKISPKKLPETPKEVALYLLSGPEERKNFNRENPWYWFPYNGDECGKTGFFSQLRSALANNEKWVEIFNEEIKKPEHKGHIGMIQSKIKEFYAELYVGPKIGELPYFTKYRLPVEVQ